MASLNDRQVTALNALGKIHQGQTVTFLNWADADSLVDLGLAENLGKGKYVITLKGLDALKSLKQNK